MSFRVSGRGDAVVELILVAVVGILIAVYGVSLHLNPWVKCSKCHGKQKFQGWAFGHAHHGCPKCKGTGRQVRWGYKFFRVGPNNGVPPI